MTNNLNEKKSNIWIIVALVSALTFTIVGLIAGLAAGLSKKSRNEAVQPKISHFLLMDAADGLRHSCSALRLCNEDETASEMSTRALVYVVRAETALECDGGLWCDCRAGEAFLNDAAAILSATDTKTAVEFADELYGLSSEFYKHIVFGAPFDYNGELEQKSVASADKKQTKADAAAARKTVEEALGSTALKEVGTYGDTVEFASDECYATVKGGKLSEFAFSVGGLDTGDGKDAEEIAEDIAKKCGYDGLSVYATNDNDGTTTVKLCDRCGGAYCRDECATVIITDGKVRAFSAGHCGGKHDVPNAKVDEQTARKAVPEKFASSLSGEGRLVTTFDGKRDRVCYEYRYELDDGEHYVYICAEDGKQMQVR